MRDMPFGNKTLTCIEVFCPAKIPSGLKDCDSKFDIASINRAGIGTMETSVSGVSFTLSRIIKRGILVLFY